MALVKYPGERGLVFEPEFGEHRESRGGRLKRSFALATDKAAPIFGDHWQELFYQWRMRGLVVLDKGFARNVRFGRNEGYEFQHLV